MRRRAINLFVLLTIAFGQLTIALAQSTPGQPTTVAPALGQPDAARTARCESYARRQVGSRSQSGAVGGAARGAVGGAIVGGIIGGADGAGTGAAVGATAGVLGSVPPGARDPSYQKYFNACMRAP